jgi:hypothetical protein
MQLYYTQHDCVELFSVLVLLSSTVEECGGHNTTTFNVTQQVIPSRAWRIAEMCYF